MTWSVACLVSLIFYVLLVSSKLGSSIQCQRGCCSEDLRTLPTKLEQTSSIILVLVAVLL